MAQTHCGCYAALVSLSAVWLWFPLSHRLVSSFFILSNKVICAYYHHLSGLSLKLHSKFKQKVRARDPLQAFWCPPSLLFFLKEMSLALADVAQWIECWTANQRVTSSIPSLGHMFGLQASSPIGGTWKGNHTLMFLSLSFSLPSSL